MKFKRIGNLIIILGLTMVKKLDLKKLDLVNHKFTKFIIKFFIAKHVFILPNTQLPVIVQYIGNHKLYQPSFHSNSKNGNLFFERSR